MNSWLTPEEMQDFVLTPPPTEQFSSVSAFVENEHNSKPAFDLSQHFGGIYQPISNEEAYCKNGRNTDRLSFVQYDLFELNPEIDDHQFRQAIFNQLPKQTADYFAKRYQQTLKRYGSQAARKWFSQEAAEKMPRIHQVLAQYADVVSLFKMPYQALDNIDYLLDLNEILEDTPTEPDEKDGKGFKQKESKESVRQYQRRIKRNVKRYQAKMPSIIQRLEKSNGFIKQNNLTPLCFLRPEQLRETAENIAYAFFECQEKELLPAHTDLEQARADFLKLYKTMIELCEPLNIVAPNQRKALKKNSNITLQEILSGMLKLISPDFWERKLKTMARQMKEHLMIACGRVHAFAPYVSNERLREFEQQRQANLEWLKNCILVNVANPEEQKELLDVFYRSSANDRIKRIELLLTTNACEQIADKYGHQGLFITLTAPSKYHAMRSTGGVNPNWNGFSPRQTQDYLCGVWANIRADFKRKDIYPYGLRVAEPHSDGTPHWHLMLFAEKAQIEEIKAIIRHYALLEDGDEPGAEEHRCVFKLIDKEKGSATGYLVKYLAKNIDGLDLKDFSSDEANLDGRENALRAKAWSSTWRIRQFARLGNAQIGLWRELRRLGDIVQDDEFIDTCRLIADLGDFAAFIEFLGGALIKRNEMPIRMAYKEREPNKYEETSKKIYGIENKRNGLVVATRTKEWKLHYKSKAEQEASQQSKSEKGQQVGELARPWTCVSNCSSAENEQNLEIYRERIKTDLTARGRRFTKYDVEDILNGKQFKLYTTEDYGVYIRLSLGRVIEEKIPKQQFH